MPVTEPIYGHLVKFKEAIAFLKQKVGITTDSWRDLQGSIHAKAFTIAGATKLQLLTDFQQVLTDMLKSGETLNTFNKDFDAIVAKHGWSYNGKRGWRAQTIYQNNLNTARAAGRWQQQERTKVKRPYLLYLTAGDLRVRREHKAWDYILLPLDDPFWRTHYPPNGWHCRCKVVSMSLDDIERMGLSVTDSAATKEHLKQIQSVDSATGETLSRYPGIDLGWDYNPGLAWLGHDLALGKSLVNLTTELRQKAIPVFSKILGDDIKGYQTVVNQAAAKIITGKKTDAGKMHAVGHLSADAVEHIIAKAGLATTVITINDAMITKLLKSGLSIEQVYKVLDVATAEHKFKLLKPGKVQLSSGDLTVTVMLGDQFNSVVAVK